MEDLLDSRIDESQFIARAAESKGVPRLDDRIGYRRGLWIGVFGIGKNSADRSTGLLA
jgi:hypothetical protein